jgi:hypothetical protein
MSDTNQPTDEPEVVRSWMPSCFEVDRVEVRPCTRRRPRPRRHAYAEDCEADG